MKNSKQKKRQLIIAYSVMAAVVITLVLYIVLRKDDRVQYELPEIKAVDSADISSIIVEGAETTELLRQGEVWIISPEGYTAKQSDIDAMLEALSNFAITDLVSTAGFYERYELDEGRKLHITAKDAGNVVRSFDMGKRAPSYNHTYVRLDADENVYHAASDLRRVFDKEKDDLREKTVMSFDANTIVNISATLPDKQLRISKPTQGVQASSEEAEVPWQTSDGGTWEAEAVNDLLDRLDDLTCAKFISSETPELGDPALTLELLGSERHTITLYRKDDEGYPAKSSFTPYPFYISGWQGDNILKPFTEEEDA